MPAGCRRKSNCHRGSIFFAHSASAVKGFESSTAEIAENNFGAFINFYSGANETTGHAVRHHLDEVLP
jgi:hypothetical protein